MPNLRLLVTLLPALLAAGCTTIPQASGTRPPTPPPRSPGQTAAPPPERPAPPPQTGFVAPRVMRMVGLEPVLQRDAAGVQALLGTPQLDVHEGDMRKLQFRGTACVLDVFLYPLQPGAEPVATHVDARRSSDGQEVDRAACLTALRRR